MRRLLLIVFAVSVAGATSLAPEETLGGDPALQVVSASTTPKQVPARNRSRRDEAKPFELVGERIPPGSFRRLAWSATELFEGVSLATPVLVAHGAHPGKVLCLTAAVHGDELNGIEIVRRVIHDLDPTTLTGTVVGVPIVSIQAFRRGSRYLPDRRDLNRHFPGSPDGSAASRVAHSLFSNIVTHCDALVDLHTGSLERTNLPQLRADLSNAEVTALTKDFGATVVVNSQPREGTLRSAATRAGIPTVTFEAGGPEQLDPEEIAHGVRGIQTLLHSLGMVTEGQPRKAREATYVSSSWVRADAGGILMSEIKLGSEVRKGDVLGRLIDPITNEITAIHAPGAGRIIGMARNQIVMPGFATYHLGTNDQGKGDRLAPPMPDHEPSDTSE